MLVLLGLGYKWELSAFLVYKLPTHLTESPTTVNNFAFNTDILNLNFLSMEKLKTIKFKTQVLDRKEMQQTFTEHLLYAHSVSEC